MKDIIFLGGSGFMAMLTLLLILTTAWIVYHFILGYNSNNANPEKVLRKIGYGKTMGLFAMIVGIIGQMNGLYAMFSTIEEETVKGKELIPELVFSGIKATMIVTVYGILIYLFSLLLWFLASLTIEKKLENKTD